jgi:hypothetical protein
MVVIAASISARDLSPDASTSACFSLGPQGLIIGKPLTSASLGAFLMSLYAALISLTSAKRKAPEPLRWAYGGLASLSRILG